ncbi:FtsQ-type POTRA domain-containing protein [Thermoanaerobacterium thermosaccharolyticum]|uniref:cell division protein FtsQ/DivIB n=1 Tax=Thermoanaerobacterium thermosaccharolyticum TaxID=1517 RepID=UPI0027991B3D|nr:FtsQ-type POTRA domain-containing protein [Thermoanaerobacterium thermosaccharolyticum]
MMEKRQFRIKKRFGILIFILLIIAIILYIIAFRSSLFDVKKIDVYGTKTIDKDDIIKMSGIATGSNIFKINKSVVIKSIMKDPYVKDVSVNILYPSKVEIKIDERKVVAQLNYKNKYLYIDTDCVAVDLGDYNDKLPLIKGINIEKFEIGSNVRKISNNKDIAKLLPLIYNKNIYKAITVNGSKIILETKSGINIVLENVDDLSYYIKFSEKILDDLEKKGYYSGNVLIVSDGNPVYMP